MSVSQATIAAQQANIRRLTQLKSFARVTAPFAGTVTQRTDRGRRARHRRQRAAASTRSRRWIPARVFVQVPQDVAPERPRRRAGDGVTCASTRGGRSTGTVARAAGELDRDDADDDHRGARARTRDGALIAGMYAEVALTLPSPHRVFEIPATALMSDAHGSRVAVVDAESKIHLVPVVVERDTGPTVEIASGLDGNRARGQARRAPSSSRASWSKPRTEPEVGPGGCGPLRSLACDVRGWGFHVSSLTAEVGDDAFFPVGAYVCGDCCGLRLVELLEQRGRGRQQRQRLRLRQRPGSGSGSSGGSSSGATADAGPVDGDVYSTDSGDGTAVVHRAVRAHHRPAEHREHAVHRRPARQHGVRSTSDRSTICSAMRPTT